MNSGRGLQRKGVWERTHAEAPEENIDSRGTSTTAARQSNPGDSMIGGKGGGTGCFGIHGKMVQTVLRFSIVSFFYVIFQVTVIYRHKCVR